MLQTKNLKFNNFYLGGYEDTQPNVDFMATDMRKKGVVGIHYPTAPHGNVLLVYSPWSEQFGFLSSGYNDGPLGENSLYVVARSQLLPITRLPLPRHMKLLRLPASEMPPPVSHSVETEKNVGSDNGSSNAPHAVHKPMMDIPPSPAVTRDGIGDEERAPGEEGPANKEVEKGKEEMATHAAAVARQNQVLGQAPGTPPRAPGLNEEAEKGKEELATHAGAVACRSQVLDQAPAPPPPPPPPAPVQAPVPDQTQASLDALFASFNLDQILRDQCSMTYDQLAGVNNGSPQSPRCFYLMIPHGDTTELEGELLIRFLKQHGGIVFSNRITEDWERFSHFEKQGVVLFHTNCTDFYKLDGLSDLLRKSFSFWTWSLSEEIEYSRPQTHFERIFPHGHAILITDDFLINEPNSTVKLLQWFSNFNRKRFPGSWKLMFPPNILEWLLKKHDSEPGRSEHQ